MAAQQTIEARPRNWLTPVTLVLLREESSYGYEILERLEEFGFEQISAGSLYRTLRRTEKEGLSEFEWDPQRLDRPAGCTQLLRLGKSIFVSTILAAPSASCR